MNLFGSTKYFEPVRTFTLTLFLVVDLSLGALFTDLWAVRVEGGLEVANEVAHRHGFINRGQIMPDYYHFQHRKVAKRSAFRSTFYHQPLQEDGQVLWAEQQVAKVRKKRGHIHGRSAGPYFNDPKWPVTWYLNDNNSGLGMNVLEAWEKGYTGAGVVVTILDDGIEKDHPDLIRNYVQICIICKQVIEKSKDVVVLREKGCKGINAAAETRGDKLFSVPGQITHKSCREKYTNKKEIAQQRKRSSPKKSGKKELRSSGSFFDSRAQCLFCGKGETSKNRKVVEKLKKVLTKDKFQESVLTACGNRDDEWGTQVLARVEFVQDCRAGDCRYHNVCFSNFCGGKRKPERFASPRKKRVIGRPEDVERDSVFCDLVKEIENNEHDSLTVTDCIEIMKTKLQGTSLHPYSQKYMKSKLTEHFKGSLTFCSIKGKADVIMLHSNATKILSEFHSEQQKHDVAIEKLRIVQTAAKLILSDIQSLKMDSDYFPDSTSLSDAQQQMECLPDSLALFLKSVISGKNKDTKAASLGQAIVQAARPRSALLPLQFGLAVHVHRSFGSRGLVDILNKLGFCSTYKLVKPFECNAALTSSNQDELDANIHLKEGQLQFIADNVDHNIRTLTGHGTFHGMGIIAVTTPSSRTSRRVPKQPIDLDDVKKIGRIRISFYRSNLNGLSGVQFTDLPQIDFTDERHGLDLLWRISWPLSSPRPGWFGFMQTLSTGDYPGKSECMFLPMIDMNPSDLSCIYSTLCFVCGEAKRHGVTPIVTFDQPLFWKAQMIVHSEKGGLNNMIVRLGMFHTIMSFLGCIGHVMQDSGFKECVEQVYAPNAVTHMLSGKAYSRAVRSHELMDAALHAILLSEAYGMPWILAHLTLDPNDDRTDIEDPERSMTATKKHLENVDKQDDDPYLRAVMDMDLIDSQGADMFGKDTTQEEESMVIDTDTLTRSFGDDDLDEVGSVFEGLLQPDRNTSQVIANHEALERVSKRLDDYKVSLSNSSRTSKLWLTYLEMIRVLKLGLMAERTGDFMLHLWVVKEMLPYFAACGHNFYAKSARLYLQTMVELGTNKPAVFNAFKTGFHVMRRSDRFWAGISSDLMIEQTLMRSVKSSGGLTRGCGFGETERTTWLLSAPMCAEVSSASRMKTLTGLDDCADHGHKESTVARQVRDHNDTRKLLTFLLKRNPFNKVYDGIVNISTGRITDKGSDVDRVKEIGEKIIASMTGKAVTEVVLKKKDQVKVLSTSSSIQKDDAVVSIDPLLLFQRLLTTARQSTPSKLQEVLSYELTNAPSSLFDSSGMMRVCQKSALASCLWSTAVAADLSDSFLNHVIDGGSLLHKVCWPRGTTYGEIADSYVRYVTSRYINAAVIFDGYSAATTTKDSAHVRRGLKTSTDIKIHPDTCVDQSKDSFLSNKNNKQQFIDLLSIKFRLADVEVGHAKSDADTLIVRHALQSAMNCDTVLVGEDTDLLVLLLYHARNEHKNIFFSSAGGKLWDIKRTKLLLGDEFCNSLLFLHAITGRDTTSHPFSVGKRIAVSRFKNSPALRKAAVSFMNTSDADVLIESGEKALVILYGGSRESLNELRYRKYMTKIAHQKQAVKTYNLPPTCAAAKFHSLRVFHQVAVWRKLSDSIDEDPTAWGWRMVDNILHPIYTDMAPAPEELLKVIVCHCKSDCSSHRCVCRRHGLNCSPACVDCDEENCTNIPQFQTLSLYDSESDNEEDEFN